VALEKRNGNLYYYRSARDGDRVRKVYEGSGARARIAHEREILQRTGRKAQRELERAELERLEALAAPVLEMSEAAQVLAHACLVAAGYRRYQGKYRRARSA
jgi:predicted Zn-dependent protease